MLLLLLCFFKQFYVCLLVLQDGVFDLWVFDLQDLYVVEVVQLVILVLVCLYVGLCLEIDDLIECWFGQGCSVMGVIIEIVDGEGVVVDDIEYFCDLVFEVLVICLVNLVI